MKQLAIRLLKEKNLKITTQRLSLLCVLLNNTPKAYCFFELLDNLKPKMNRSTIYRSLDILNEKGLITKMIDSNGHPIYALNIEERCNDIAHSHVKCYQCGILTCLPAYPSEYVNELYKAGVRNLNTVLRGICSSCSTKQSNGN